ncbi:hypothetical protein SeMB42_g02439 [Synchytrium endobioticum]|uniref:Phosphodiesterase n=1 Tax=Synchytrium endobioticum TaxID=286115 RepID=A0A507DEP4_9FUNG|nr:hypothetical protein SeMB42_g02439 [Synchytrium endobioticum]
MAALTTRKVYLRVVNSHKDEAVELPANISDEDARSLLLSAADTTPEAATHVRLSRSSDNSVLAINRYLPANDPTDRYCLDVKQGVKDNRADSLSSQFADLLASNLALKDVTDMKNSLSAICRKLYDVDKTIAVAAATTPATLTSKTTARIAVQRLSKLDPHYTAAPKYLLSDETRAYLKQPSFDNWVWDENEIAVLLEHIFEDLGLIHDFAIERTVLRRFLIAIKDNYNHNPFHNFRHCFCVTQMMYAIVHTTGAIRQLKPIDRLVLTVACIGHDLDHPGYNNAYQINAKTELAIVYNDQSPLENHHCAMLFTILRNPETDIFKNIPDATYRDARKTIIKCILATDMAKHGEILAQFKKASDAFSYDDVEHKTLLLQMIVKCSDISNEVRPADVAEPWVDCLLQEFFSQSDREKAEGLPTAPFMDREKVTKSGAQVGKGSARDGRTNRDAHQREFDLLQGSGGQGGGCESRPDKVSYLSTIGVVYECGFNFIDIFIDTTSLLACLASCLLHFGTE